MWVEYAAATGAREGGSAEGEAARSLLTNIAEDRDAQGSLTLCCELKGK
jgi:hypothetical protein